MRRAPGRRGFLAALGGAVCGAALGRATPAAAQASHRAKRAIFVVLGGGLSHVDTFDPKPALVTHAGKSLAGALGQPPTDGARGTILPSPWRSRPRSEAGVEVTDLFAGFGELLDRFWIFRGMTTSEHLHGPALRLLVTGQAQPGHPAIGAWLAHHLGPGSSDLPPFVVLGHGRFARGDELWSAAYLPPPCHGAFLDLGAPASWHARPQPAAAPDRERERLRREMDRRLAETSSLAGAAADPLLRRERRERERLLREVATALYPARPRKGSASALDYGDTPFGRACRLACDLVEKGPRMVQVFSGTDATGRLAWDSHDGFDALEREARTADRALAALVRDLERRGLYDETLLVVATEFGRSPLGVDGPSGRGGRDHNPLGFTALVGGAGVGGGKVRGATDELGLRATDEVLCPQDLLATALTRFRVKPVEMTYRQGGRFYSAFDPGTQIIRDLRIL